MEQHGVAVDELRAVDHDIATGTWPDMTEHGWPTDAWPAIYRRVLQADILVLCGPIWLGDNSSVTKRVIERLYACSSLLNDAGQYAYYGRVGGCLLTGNEDGVKHCAMNVLYSLQHLGYTIPPQADAGWIGAAGPGPPTSTPAPAVPRTISPTATPPSRPGTSCTWGRCCSGPGASRHMATSARRGRPAAASTSTTPNTASAGLGRRITGHLRFGGRYLTPAVWTMACSATEPRMGEPTDAPGLASAHPWLA
jgi:multimeric flavodoxin WrbA